MRVHLIFILLIILLTGACSPGIIPYKLGERKLERGEYQLAIEDFSNAIDKGYKLADSYYYIGESYRQSNRIEEARKYYNIAVEMLGRDDAYIKLSDALQANGQYDSARQVLEHYLTLSTEQETRKLAEFKLNNLNIFIDEILNKETYYRIKPLAELNTAYGEFAPVYNLGRLYFSSNRGNEAIYNATGTPYYNVYQVETQGANANLNTLMPIPGEINESDVHEGPVTFTPDGSTMVFAKSNTGKRRGLKEVNLYVSNLRRSGWTAPRLIRVNDPESWDSTPSFHPDGRTLYFSSNRKGGFGGTDIYIATLDSRGRFGNVRNAGPKINTPGNEMFPFIGEDGRLYFASDGHPGFGKLDIFAYYREDGEYKVENLGKPVNSIDDDFGIFLFRADRGFFTSNRAGGMGDDDLYTFVNEDPDLKIVNYFLTGKTVTPENDSTTEMKTLGATTVKIYAQDGELLDQATTNLLGTFEFRVYENEDYYLTGEKDGYFTTRIQYSMKSRSVNKDTLTELVTNVTYDTLLPMNKIELDKTIVLDNIYYDLDKAFIRQDAAKELDKLVEIMKDNESIKIELSSHTDARNDDFYNLRLSQRRADSAVAYIVKNGIDPERLVARGYGESQLIIKNAQTEEEHQVNRRTEFKVIAFMDKNPMEVVNKGDSVRQIYSDDDRFFNDDSRFFDNNNEDN